MSLHEIEFGGDHPLQENPTFDLSSPDNSDVDLEFEEGSQVSASGLLPLDFPESPSTKEPVDQQEPSLAPHVAKDNASPKLSHQSSSTRETHNVELSQTELHQVYLIVKDFAATGSSPQVLGQRSPLEYSEKDELVKQIRNILQQACQPASTDSQNGQIFGRLGQRGIPNNLTKNNSQTPKGKRQGRPRVSVKGSKRRSSREFLDTPTPPSNLAPIQQGKQFNRQMSLTSGFEYSLKQFHPSEPLTTPVKRKSKIGNPFLDVGNMVTNAIKATNAFRSAATETDLRQQTWRRSESLAKFNELGSYTLGDGSKDNSNKCFEETQIFAPELMFLMTLSAMYTPTDAGYFLRVIWPRFVLCAFFFCIAVCTYRLFGHTQYGGGPAFYNSYTNGVFVLVHLWLPHAFLTSQSLINAPFLLESLREFSKIEPLKQRIFFFSRVTGIIGLGLTGSIVIWVILGWVIDFLDPYYIHSNQNSRFWFGVSSAVSFMVIVVPWVACLLAVYSMFHVVLAVLDLHVEELVYTLDLACDEIYSSEDRLVAQSKRQVTRSFYNCFQGTAPLPAKLAMNQMMNHFNARSAYMSGRWSLRHKKSHKLDVMPFKMKLWKLRTLVSLVSKRVNFMMASLIAVSLALVLVPCYGILVTAREGEIDTWKHLLRDGFCVTVGLLSLYLALWETSAFTEKCSLAGTVINEMDFPDSDDRIMVMGYFTNGDSRLGFEINGVLITKTLFFNFVYITISGVFYCIFELSM